MTSSESQRVKMVAGYALQQKIGSGSFATVYKGVRVNTNHSNHSSNNDSNTVADRSNQDNGDTSTIPPLAAVKAISRTSDKLTPKVLQNLEVEISILRTYKHRNIVCMPAFSKTPHHFYLILEYCAGGDVQNLIRSRRNRRVSEGLTRRLMRDLAAGLQFLWAQELIHRDIKPQNLLLTGPLPLDEINDPERTPEAEAMRRKANFPSQDFTLKIADFGFARHLQTTTLAETLCGSPLYMAPEILQHHRYDAKADLWSVGTVLFEMISGDPPFHGENHIDLLRNIQRKAVRLPKDVRVSKECVTLLRLLLSRNPLSRAGFKEFFQACDAFVALGCQGTAVVDMGTCKRPSDLGTIPEGVDAGTMPRKPTESMITTGSSAPPPKQKPLLVYTPAAPTTKTTRTRTNMLSPLAPSPPASLIRQTELPTLSSRKMPQPIEMPTRHNEEIALQGSSGENSFVMVEYGTQPKTSESTSLVSHYGEATFRQDQLVPSPPSSPGFTIKKTAMIPRTADYAGIMKSARGMLGTSPGTGGALMGLLTGRPQLVSDGPVGKQIDAQLKACTKLLATSEDVGRRAVSVAHLGDKRAYVGVRLVAMDESASSSILTTTPMEGIEEEGSGDRDSGEVTDDSGSTEIMASIRRRRSSSATDKSMPDVTKTDNMEEMPFAMPSDSSPPLVTAGLPTRASVSFKEPTSRNRAMVKPTPSVIRSHFNEALVCYVKALKMLKGAVSASEGVAKDLDSLIAERLTNEQRNFAYEVKKRNEQTLKWLGDQFRGVLERGDAANTEIGKFPPTSSVSTVSAEELLYCHALGIGREGAVKQLLGHNEAARSCYRTAGLLAETLLMEQRIKGNDRKSLEDYVDGFASQIREIDEILLKQSRLAGSNATMASSSRRGMKPLGIE